MNSFIFCRKLPLTLNRGAICYKQPISELKYSILRKRSCLQFNNYFGSLKSIGSKIHHCIFQRKVFFSTSILDVNTKVTKDVILFNYENPKFFRIVNIFALSQFGFWAYLSHFAYTSLKDAPAPKEADDIAWWRKINLGENKYRNGLAILSFIVGYGILTTAWLFTLKSVRYLILRKGGDKVTFVTYTPFGKNRMLTVDINKVSSQETRQNARVQLPIKVKGHRLYYILDMRGDFKNTKLFDNTAGMRRTWRD